MSPPNTPIPTDRPPSSPTPWPARQHPAADAAERFRLTAAIFERLRTLPIGEREALLVELCGEDADLQIEVRSLLAHHEAPPDALDRSVLRPGPGATIGRYRIDGVLGEGGMGTVYRATQVEPVRREVALKVIKLGMDTRQVIRRFEAERQTLAKLEHPNVARVLDGGATPDGRPYFVMELVRGVPITEHCDARRLNWRERLLLVRQVCDAVHHAHQRGILHRDIKPSNLLVAEIDGRAVPKVIDFGVAKALDASDRTVERSRTTSMGTAAGVIVGTPDFMSPEQAAGADVDIRTDVYTIGVVLYELLVGVTPMRARTTHRRGASASELRRRLLEDEPIRPSSAIDGERAAVRSTTEAALRRAIRGDLDWIVLKALAREPGRRYASVAALADDIDRLLAHDVVSARPPSTAYLLAKFARRHTVALVAAGLVATSLVAATVVSLAALGIARNERDSARQAERAQARLAGELSAELFASDIERGRQAARQGNWAEARALLSEAIERDADSPHARWAMRELVWAQGCLATWRLDGRVDYLRLLPDQRSILSAARDGPLTLLDIEDGSQRVIAEVPVRAWELDISADGRWILTADAFGMIQRWDVAGGMRPTAIVECGTALSCVRCSTDAPVAFAGGLDGILWRIPLDESPDGSSAAPPRPISVGARIKRIAIAPDGTVAAGRDDGSISLVAPDGSHERVIRPHDRPIQSLAFGRAGRLIASGTTGPAIVIVDTETGEVTRRLQPRVGTFRDLRFGPDDRTLIVLGWWAVHELSLQDESLRTLVPTPGWRFDLSRDGTQLALASEGTQMVSVWDLSHDGGGVRGVAPTRSVVRPIGGAPDPAAPPFLASLERGLSRLDVRGRLDAPIPASRVRAFRADLQGERIVTVEGERRLRVVRRSRDAGTQPWVEQSRVQTERPVRADPSTLSFGGDRLLAFADDDNAVHIVDLADGTICEAVPAEGRETLAVALSPDGAWLTVVQRRGVNIFLRLADGARFEQTIDTTGFWTDFTADGSRCLIGTWRGEIVVRDMPSGSLTTLAGHASRVLELAPHPTDPDLAVSGSEDGTVRVWHLGLGREVAQLRPFEAGTAVRSVGFVQSGEGISAVGSDGQLVTYSMPRADRMIRQTGAEPMPVTIEE